MYKLLTNKWTAVTWTVVIFLLLGLDNEHVPEVSMFNFKFRDKFYHCIVFTVYAFLWFGVGYRNTMTSLKKLYMTVFITGLIFGIGMEFFQEAFTNRQFSWWDGFADMIGLFLGLGIAKKSPYGNRGRNQN